MSDSFRRVFVALYLANGAAALIYQVVWERVLTFTVGSDTRAVTLIVASFMAGLGIGSGSDRPFDCDEAVIRRRAEEPFTRAHYASAGIDLGSELTPYFSEPVELIGPAYDRRMLNEMNHDLFPKDEFSRRPAAGGRR